MVDNPLGIPVNSEKFYEEKNPEVISSNSKEYLNKAVEKAKHRIAGSALGLNADSSQSLAHQNSSSNGSSNDPNYLKDQFEQAKKNRK